MIRAPAAWRVLTALTKASAVGEPVAKRSGAPGAQSWTISSIAVPSSPGALARTVTAGRSPVAWEAARPATPSEITPTAAPMPVNPMARAWSQRWMASPWELTTPVLGEP